MSSLVIAGHRCHPNGDVCTTAVVSSKGSSLVLKAVHLLVLHSISINLCFVVVVNVIQDFAPVSVSLYSISIGTVSLTVRCWSQSQSLSSEIRR